MVTTNELLELSQKVENRNKIYSNSDIVPIIELGQDLSLPLKFKARVLRPGTYYGYTFDREDIKRNMNSIFKVINNVANNELNLDHKNNRKQVSSVLDLVGSIVSLSYDNQDDALWAYCEVTDRNVAEKIIHKLYKFVSLRINPLRSEEINGLKYARDFDYEELSIVRNPACPDAQIMEIMRY